MFLLFRLSRGACARSGGLEHRARPRGLQGSRGARRALLQSTLRRPSLLQRGRSPGRAGGRGRAR
eukprot:3236480-Alexandrium_andersonii.AAC.1